MSGRHEVEPCRRRPQSLALDRYPGGALASVRLIERPGSKGQREWHCAACNYRVRPQTVVEIRNGSGLVQCDSCKRILFLEAEPA